MNERTVALDVADEHAAISKAWEQVNPEDLVRALREVPSKTRGRMLSKLKTPSSKVTSITARLLLTNLARATHQDRFRAADTITGSVVDNLGETADKATSMQDLADAVTAEARTSGQSIVVLAAVFGLVGDADRFAAVMAACRKAGYLGPELAALADSLLHAIKPGLASKAAEVAAPQVELSEHEPLEKVWEKAVASTGRLADDIGAGRLPADSDLEVLAQYAHVLSSQAERFEVETRVAAVQEAATRAEIDAAMADLADQLRRLAGPEDVSAGLSAVHAAADRVSTDRALADRLSRFLEVVSGSDNATRFQLARDLRGQPEPPSQELLDAAMLGMLRIAEEVQSSPATSEAQPAMSHHREPTPQLRQPQHESPANVDKAHAAVARLAHQADFETDTVSETEPTVGQTVGGEDVAASAVTLGHHPLTQVNGQDVGDARIGVAEPCESAGDAIVADLESAAVASVAATTSEERRDGVAAYGEEQAGAETGALAGAESAAVGEGQSAACDEPHTPGQLVDVDVLTRDKCGLTLANLIEARRFSLAYHLALGLGHDVRAAVLAEAALAEGVRHSA